MQLELATIAEWCHGKLIGQAASVHAVATDSRKPMPNALFVALKGENFDAHAFLANAHSQGATAALVDNYNADLPELAQIVVADTQKALGVLAGRWLQQMPAKRLALTGSNGKTTVKNLTFSILAKMGATAATQGNLNNEIGLPLTALSVKSSDRFAILEMGAGQPGDISYLANIAKAQITLVNNAGAAHLERLGSVQGVAEEKAAIYRHLTADGIAVLPQDDPHLEVFVRASAHCQQLHFGFSAQAQVRAESVELAEQAHFDLVGPFGRAKIDLPLLGLHNVRNALAAASLAYAAGADLDAIKSGLENSAAAPGRLRAERQPAGWLLLDDSYNANPNSVKAGIDALVALDGESILVLGDMAELGADTQALHAGVGAHARTAGVHRLLCLGAKSKETAKAAGAIAEHFENLDDLVRRLRMLLSPAARVLIKGSRSSRMERVVEALKIPQLGGTPC